LQRGLVAAEKALKCDDRDAISYFSIARIQMMQGDHDASIKALRTSISFNPCFAQSYHGLGFALALHWLCIGFALALAGELEAAKEMTEMAIKMSPRDPMLWAFHGVHAITLVLIQEFEAALESTQIALPSSTGYWSHAVAASALGNLDRLDEAAAMLKAAIQAKPDLSIEFVRNNLLTKQPDGLDIHLNGLRKAGLE